MIIEFIEFIMYARFYLRNIANCHSSERFNLHFASKSWLRMGSIVSYVDLTVPA